MQASSQGANARCLDDDGVLIVHIESGISCRHGGMADAMDSKSIVRKDVWVQVPLPALDLKARSSRGAFFSCFIP